MYTTIMGFDFGTKNVGVAVGQTITRTANGLATLDYESQNIFWTSVNELVQQWRPQLLVVGLPLNMDGSEQWITDLVRQFGRNLHETTQLPVAYVDERLTTRQAREQVYQAGGYRALNKESIDAVAAATIVEAWMEANA